MGSHTVNGETSQTLSRHERLTGRKEYIRVYRQGRRIRIPGLVIRFAENSLPYCRLGISIRKKIGKAVIRNRIKRMIREFFRRNKKLFPPGHDIVFIPDRDFLHTDWDKLLREKLNKISR